MNAIPFTEWADADFADLRDDLDRARRRRNRVGEHPQASYVNALDREISALQQIQDAADAHTKQATR